MPIDRPTDAQLALFLEFLRFPSVSTQPAHAGDVRACAEWVRARFQAAGLEAAVHETPGHPAVVARSRMAPGRKTVLIYGHYDVQPVDPLDLWRKPPFEPWIEDGIVTARGSSDNKGQILSHIFGVEEELREAGALPVNVVFLVEGEEEIGSPSLPGFLKARAAELRCDVAVVSDMEMAGRGVPTLTYGLRGLGGLEIAMTGPSRDLHSGLFGGAVVNPLAAMARLLASLHGPDGRVAVEGFYDGARPLAGWEREAWARAGATDAGLLEHSGAPELGGEAGYSGVERIWGRPTVEINGLWGGYQGAGSKTVLPSEAHAKITFRLVPDMNPEVTLERVAAHLKKHAPRGVRLEITPRDSGKPFLTDPNSGYGAAAQRALRGAFGGREVALIRNGGTVPVVADFRDILGVDTLLLGLQLPGCGAHSPNETFPLENMAAGIRLNRAALQQIAAMG